MESSKRKALEERRQELRTRLLVKEWVLHQFDPFCEVLNELDRNSIVYDIHQLVNIPRSWEPLLREELATASHNAYRNSNFSFCEHYPLINRLLEVFPGTNPFRYVPDLPKYEVDTVKELCRNFRFKDQIVYLFYFSYGVVLTLRLFDLFNAENDSLFNLAHGDTVIFPADYSWLIAFSIEEEWYAGRAF